MTKLVVVGGGLAGCEAAWQAAQRGVRVVLYEMRPVTTTEAHTSACLAELVCSNSFGSKSVDRASGLLKEELRKMGSLLIQCADRTAVPAGGALAVDREVFAKTVTEIIEEDPRIRVVRQEVAEIPDGLTIIASGPLTSARLARSIQELTGCKQLYFYDAIAPIVTAGTIDMEIAYRGSRYGRGEQQEGDYINCPMNQEEYITFVDALIHAQRVVLKDFEQEIESGVRAGSDKYFEGCLPVEVLAQRGTEALAYGPMRPVGLNDPRTGRRPFATVQLRQDNLAGTLYNLVGFQTNLAYSEQHRIFRRIPGLQDADFVRYGQMHRNTFISSPDLLKPTLQNTSRDDLFFAGQITGVEGYAGNIATGLLAGINSARIATGEGALTLPVSTMLGALCHYITHVSQAAFQPMKANFGILPPLEGEGSLKRSKRERGAEYARRSLMELGTYLIDNGEYWGD